MLYFNSTNGLYMYLRMYEFVLFKYRNVLLWHFVLKKV